ncbi:hypothetical protein DH2020_025081 [Rehmannia glutinosa]|uniref:Uncharacterized protein n=1 Tax=Rehmannia glutinosa TaxID=99300 RepID=A0ABR0W0P2_REHGL
MFKLVQVTCRLVGVILEESSPEELQKQATVKSSVLEVLLEITKFCDLYLMERVLDDESEITNWLDEFVQKKVLTALEDAGVFTSGGLVKDKVLFCSTENGRTSFVRQLEPDWHIDSNPEIITQLASCRDGNSTCDLQPNSSIIYKGKPSKAILLPVHFTVQRIGPVLPLEYGVDESWILLVACTGWSRFSVKPLAYIEDGDELIFVTQSNVIVRYEFETRTFKTMVCRCLSRDLPSLFAYIPNLVCPSKWHS